ncbi:AAA family ATPase [Acinetobacter sp. ANC 5584]
MNYIRNLSHEDIEIPLQGRHLIITGKNGSGKTYFLNQIRHTIVNKSSNENQYLKENQSKLIELLNYLLDKYTFPLDLTEDNINLINHVIRKNDFSKKLIISINDTLNTKYNIFLKNKEFFFKTHKKMTQQQFIIASIKHPEIEQDFHYYSPEFLENLIKKIDFHSKNIIKNKKIIEIFDSTNKPLDFKFFDSSRVPSIEGINMKIFQSYETLKNTKTAESPNLLETYLLSIRSQIDELLKNRSIESGHVIYSVNQIQKWFIQIENDLKYIFEDDTIELSFSENGHEVLINIKNKGRNFTFEQLSSGFKAIFYIYSSLLMEAHSQEKIPLNYEGIVIIDEIDVHLHISLQKKILPFLIKTFPKAQFIVSTHSPFVITSIDKNTVVYDISSGELFEENLSHYSHESIIKELFHVTEENSTIKVLSDQLLKFIELENSTQDLNAIQDLLNEINKDFEKLPVEIQLQYMVAKNKLAKLKHKGN